MRRQKIMTLHRRHARPTGRPVFVRFTTDGPGDIRRLDDIESVLNFGEIQELYGLLHPRPVDFKNMEIEEIAAFVRMIGLRIGWTDDGANCEFFQSH